jgi:FXSXX-COOH protein
VGDVTGDVVSGLIDLTEIDLGEVATLDNSILAHVLQRIREEAEHPDEAVAGFQASL